MLDHGQFLQAILDSPNDSGPGLVYADWLEESGDCHRAEFLRLDAEWLELPKTEPRRSEVARRLVNLFYRHGDTWDRPRIDLPAHNVLPLSPAIVRLAPVCDIQIDPAALNLARDVVEIIPASIAYENRALPLGWIESDNILVDPYPLKFRWDQEHPGHYRPPSDQRTLVLAAERTMRDPEFIQKVEFILNCNVFCLYADAAKLQEEIERQYPPTEIESIISCTFPEYPEMDINLPEETDS
jgi:uncharacterized protein (TIGR02996 family)